MPPTVDDLPGLSWRALCEDPRFAFLADQPFKIETNRRGQIVMSPTYQRHGYFAAEIAFLLRTLPDAPGAVVVECAVRTADGVKEADVAWYTADRWAQVKDAYDAPVAPQIWVEVLSPYNTTGEIDEKRQLYVGAGAEEVWTCDAEGHLRFFDRAGERSRSGLVPAFPDRIGEDAAGS